MKFIRKKKVNPAKLMENPTDSLFIKRLKQLLKLSVHGRYKNKDWNAMKSLLSDEGHWKNKTGPVKNTGRNLKEYLQN